LRRAASRVAQAKAAAAKSEMLAQQTEVLQESERQFRYILKYTPNSVAVFDREMRYFMVSDRYLSDFKVTLENVIGRSHYEVFPNLPEGLREIHRRCLQGAVRKRKTRRFTTPMGRWTGCDGNAALGILATERWGALFFAAR